MPSHDIIDNRQERLADPIKRILSSTEAARFAVGYIFISGLLSNGGRQFREGQIAPHIRAIIPS